MSHYIGPSWAVAPSSQHEWILVEIKSGVEVARHDLSSRPYTLIGRDADACQIILQHESCSRIHARIAFDGNSGIPWLRDLQSTHGTTVNKKKLPPLACGKLEASASSTKTGARGVILFPSDILQFGASTRIYCLQGPTKFARGAKQLLQKQQEANNKLLLMSSGDGSVCDSVATSGGDELIKQQQKQDANEKDETCDGVSWGIDMDDHHDDHDHDDSQIQRLLPTNLDESKIPEKHRKEWDRLRALRYKLENVQEESSRILRKGNHREDLTQGQERQLQRNQERQETLQRDIQEKETILCRKLFPDKIAATSRQQQSKDMSAYNNADEDEVEDRTMDETRRIQEGILFDDNNEQRRKNDDNDEDDNDAEDEQSLRSKRSLLLEKQHAIQTRIAQAQETASMLQARITSDRDGEECFFIQNDLDIVKDSLSKSQKEQAAVNKLLAQTERLLKIVNPKINFNETSTSNTNSSTFIAAAITTTTTTADPSTDKFMPAPLSIMPAPLPPPAKKRGQSSTLVDGNAITSDATVTVKDCGNIETFSSLPIPPRQGPPHKRPRVLGPSMPPPSSSMSTISAPPGSTQVENKQYRPRPKGSTLDVLSASLLSSSSSSDVPKSHSTQKGTTSSKNNTTTNAEKPLVALTMDDEKHDQWVKPKDQDGSGITKLNKKFAGRY